MKLLTTLFCLAFISYSTAQPGTVLSEQKISDTQGNFLETLGTSDHFGNGMAGIGDLNNDGVEDIVVGAEQAGVGGSIYVLFMNTNGTVNTSQQITTGVGGFVGPLVAGDDFGYTIAAIGDLDNDGVMDIAVGAEEDNNQGAVWILFMNTDGTVKAEQKINETNGGFTGSLGSNNRFSYGLAGIGDLNNDGNEDIAVGALMDDDGGNGRGAVWILFLNSNGTVASHQKISDTQGNFLEPLQNGDNLGSAIAGLGDLDGDGVEDIAVGAYLDDDGSSDAGAVYIMFLNTNGTVKSYQKISDTQGGFTGIIGGSEYFGNEGMANMGDINGDGIVDLAVGQNWDGDGGAGQGAVWTLFLNTDGTVNGYQKISETTGGFVGPLDGFDLFGTSIANIGDLDGDGKTDMAVGVPRDDDGGGDKGAVYILNLDGVAAVCTNPDVPSALSASPSTICPGATSTLTWTGALNDATQWHIYTGSCGGTQVGTSLTNSFITPAIGATTTFYIRGEDGAGCVDESTGSCGSITVTVADAVAPTAVCQNINVYLDGAGNASITGTDLDGGSTDNCSGITFGASQTAFTCADLGPNSVTLTVTDGNSNSDNCMAVVTVIDTISPSTVCQNINVYLDGAGNATMVAADIDGGSTDNCSGVTLSASQTTFTCADLGPNNVTLTVTDGNSNSSNCIAVVTVMDTISPVIVCPGNENLNSTPTVCFFFIGSLPPVSVADNCGSPNITWALTGSTIASGSGTFASSVVNVGLTTVTYSATDASGNVGTCSFTIQVNDVTPPATVCQNITVYLDGAGNASITAADIDGGSTDICSSVTLSASQTAFTCADVGANNVTLTVTDGSSNSANCIAVVTVLDTISPVVSCLSNQTENLDASCNFTVPDYTVLVAATDNCSGSPAITQSPVPSTVVSGTTTISITADDGNGNTTVCTFDLVLNDVTPPVAVCQNINVYLDGSGNATIAGTDIDGGSTDNCSGLTFSASQTSFTCADLGTNSVTLTVTDGSSNSVNCVATVTVLDTISPIVATLANVTGECSATATVPTTTDNCAGTITGTTTDPLTYTTQGTFVINWTFDDGNGNTSTQTQSVVIADITAPIADITNLVDYSDECPVALSTLGGSPTATDNCSGTITGTPDVTFPITASGTTTITWTYDDGNGNTSTQTQDVTITPIDNGITQVDAITLSADAIAASYSYQWVDCNNGNAPVSGATSQTFTPTVAGSYACEIDNGFCMVTTACLTSSVGITENTFGYALIVYPNPTFGNIIIDLGKVYNDVEVKVFNALGQVIINELFGSTDEINLNIEGTPGMYILEINTDEGKTARVNVFKE